MTSIHKELVLGASPETVWDVVRDVGAVATRFAPGFVVDVQMQDGARVVTFANGMVARELIVDLDEAARRLAYAVRSERLLHHNASFQVLEGEAGGCRLVWHADVLPDAAGPNLDAMMTQGLEAAKRALDRVSA